MPTGTRIRILTTLSAVASELYGYVTNGEQATILYLHFFGTYAIYTPCTNSVRSQTASSKDTIFSLIGFHVF